MIPVRRQRCADCAAIVPRPGEARRPFIPRLLVGRFAACRHRVAEWEGGNQPACSSFGKEFFA